MNAENEKIGAESFRQRAQLFCWNPFKEVLFDGDRSFGTLAHADAGKLM